MLNWLDPMAALWEDSLRILTTTAHLDKNSLNSSTQFLTYMWELVVIVAQVHNI